MIEKYEISDEDIEKTLNYLKRHVSKNSTREDARKKLEDFGSYTRILAINEPERFSKLKQKIDKPHKV
jgi:hypothetical protein